MFLHRLQLTNVRSIERLTLDFAGAELEQTRKWTLLLAENGTGKTTLLRAIALITAGGDALAELLGDVDGWIREGQQEARLEADVYTPAGELHKLRLVLQRGDSLSTLLERNRDSLKMIEVGVKPSDSPFFVVGYGVSRRPGQGPVFSNFSAGFRSTRAQSVATLFTTDATLWPLDAWAMDLDYRLGDLDVVQVALDHLLPGVTFKGVDKERRQLLFSTPDGTVPLERLSDGYQNVAAWCGDLLHRLTETFPNRKRPLDARGVLLIDEIDLHLHPRWQRRLIDYLGTQLPNFQIVATTHSPLTAQQAGPGELLVLRRPSPRAAPQVYPYEGNPRLLRIEQLIVSPLFGLETGLSWELEEARHTYETLGGQSKTSAQEKQQLHQAVDLLEAVPEAASDNPVELERVRLLRELQTALEETPRLRSKRKARHRAV